MRKVIKAISMLAIFELLVIMSLLWALATSPTPPYTLISEGNIYFKDGNIWIGNDENYTLFTEQGWIELSGSARVMRVITIDLERWTKDAVDPPGWSNEAGFLTADFDDGKNESIYFVWHTCHTYADDGQIHVHLDFFVDSLPGANSTIVWTLEYKHIPHNDIFNFTNYQTLSVSNSISTTDLTKQMYQSGQMLLNTTGWCKEDVVLLKLYRPGGLGGDDYTGDARLINIHVEFLSDGRGEPYD